MEVKAANRNGSSSKEFYHLFNQHNVGMLSSFYVLDSFLCGLYSSGCFAFKSHVPQGDDVSDIVVLKTEAPFSLAVCENEGLSV